MSDNAINPRLPNYCSECGSCFYTFDCVYGEEGMITDREKIITYTNILELVRQINYAKSQVEDLEKLTFTVYESSRATKTLALLESYKQDIGHLNQQLTLIYQKMLKEEGTVSAL